LSRDDRQRIVTVVTLSVFHAGKVKQSQEIRNPLVWSADAES